MRLVRTNERFLPAPARQAAISLDSYHISAEGPLGLRSRARPQHDRHVIALVARGGGVQDFAVARGDRVAAHEKAVKVKRSRGVTGPAQGLRERLPLVQVAPRDGKAQRAKWRVCSS